MRRGVKVRASHGSIPPTASFIATRTARRRQRSASRPSGYRRGCSPTCADGNASTRLRRRPQTYVVTFRGAKVASVKTALNTACKLAGVDHATMYTLRHTTASWEVAKGRPTRMVADFLGTSEQMILRPLRTSGARLSDRNRRIHRAALTRGGAHEKGRYCKVLS